MIKTVLFDLDGTLLPMEQDKFVRTYFGALAKKLAPYGYESEALIKVIWQGTAMMVKNNGEKLNEERFWDAFAEAYGEKSRNDEAILADFYVNDFDKVSASCGFNKSSSDVIDLVKKKGMKCVLATNPIFPEMATRKRIGWAGLKVEDFEHVTHYSNSHYCKPNPEYYKEILKELSLDPSECLMVGNDVREDMVARSLGMRVFLLTDCLINKDGEDISGYPNGSFDELLAFIDNLNG